MSGILFTDFTHEEMVEGVHALAAAMEADHWRPTLLVGIGRGGLAPAVYLSHRLDLPLVSVDHSARIAPFGDALIAELAARCQTGDRLLFVEDINDSGGTIGEIRAALTRHGAIEENIRFAVLLDNIRSAQRIDYRFRSIDRHVDKDWFVFPWEAMMPREKLVEEALEVPERLG
jgi:uncharacterized protein